MDASEEGRSRSRRQEKFVQSHLRLEATDNTSHKPENTRVPMVRSAKLKRLKLKNGKNIRPWYLNQR